MLTWLLYVVALVGWQKKIVRVTNSEIVFDSGMIYRDQWLVWYCGALSVMGDAMFHAQFEEMIYESQA